MKSVFLVDDSATMLMSLKGTLEISGFQSPHLSQAASRASSRSDSSRSISAWHSGSPKRTLNSISFGPSAPIMRPAKSTPLNGVPRRRISEMTGSIIRDIV